MRIIGGIHRSRTLVAPRGAATRPTSDRVREALFSLLSGRIAWDGARVLDLYAGTGSLALEALSRGARCATLVEQAKAPLIAIHANVKSLNLTECVDVIASSVERAMPRVREKAPFEVIFIDPPYALVASGDFAQLWSDLACHDLLGGAGVAVLEHASSTVPPGLTALQLDDTRRYGDTSLSLYARAPVAFVQR